MTPVLDGERQAFEEFFLQLSSAVASIAASNMSVNEREDIVHMTLTRAFRYLHTYRGEASLCSWVCQICLNMIRAWYRKKKTSKLSLSSLQHSPERCCD